MIIKYLKENRVLPAFFSTLFFGFLIGIYLWNIFFGYTVFKYEVHFDANWIAYPDIKVPQSYFRKKIHLSNKDEIKNAYLKVSAPDGFKIYFNGNDIGSVMAISDIATKIYDITHLLQDGVNVLAIDNHIEISDRSRILVEGYYEYISGMKQSIISDGSWKVSSFEQNQIDNGPKWYDINFKDAGWKNVAELEAPYITKKGRITHDPAVITSMPDDEFIWTDSHNDKSGFFRYPLYIQEMRMVKDVWLRMIEESGYSYNFIVNGIPVAYINNVGTHGQTNFKRIMNIYNITEYLHTGENTIGIFVYSENSSPRLYTDGIISSKIGSSDLFHVSKGVKYTKTLNKNWYDKSFDDTEWKEALLLGRITHSDMPENKIITDTSPPVDYYMLYNLKKYLFIIIVVLSVLIFWLAVSYIFSKSKQIEYNNSLSIIGIINFFLFLVLFFIYMFSFDIRFSASYPFQIKFLILTVSAFIGVFVIALFQRQEDLEKYIESRIIKSTSLEYFFIFILFLAGFAMRLYSTDFKPLGGDEVTMYYYSKGLLEGFYPYINIAPNLPPKIITTSELVPYFMAIGIKLFGSNEMGIRFSGVFFGSLTIIIIYLIGKDIFGRRVGVLSAIIYTFMPFTVNYSQFARYPSQVQFFSLLSAYFFYKCVSEKEISYRYIYLTSLTFLLSYFSWEGAGFLLPSFFGAMLLSKRTDFSWLKSKHLWYAVCITIFVVFVHLSLRYIYSKGTMMMIGIGRSSISLAPQWVEPVFDPTYYINNFYLLDNLMSVSIFLFAGLLFFIKDKVLSCFYGIIIISTFFMTFFFEIKSTRYLYFIMPLVLLTGVHIFIRFLDYILSHRSKFGIYSGRVIQSLAFAIILLPSNDLIMKPYNIPMANSRTSTKTYFYDINNRAAIAYLNEHIRPGDAIISNWSHVVKFFLGRCEYYTENKLQLPVAVSRDKPLAAHRVTGVPLVYNIANLKDILGKHERLWFVFSTFEISYLDQEFVDFIKKNAHSVYEDYMIVVYLWDR